MKPLSGYLCHACGSGLYFLHGSRMLWCDRCGQWRRVPTHPALVHAEPPLGYHFPPLAGEDAQATGRAEAS